MKYEDEITVMLDMSYDEINNLLLKNKFYVVKKYVINDIYFSNKNINSINNYLDILKRCILIRNLVFDENEINLITYKYKEISKDGKITKQGKSECEIKSISDAKSLLNNIGYNEFLSIRDELTIYENGNISLAVQKVNNKHLYIEIENDGNFNSLDEIIDIINKLKIKIKNNNYFALKAEIELIEKYGKK